MGFMYNWLIAQNCCARQYPVLEVRALTAKQTYLELSSKDTVCHKFNSYVNALANV